MKAAVALRSARNRTTSLAGIFAFLEELHMAYQSTKERLFSRAARALSQGGPSAAFHAFLEGYSMAFDLDPTVEDCNVPNRDIHDVVDNFWAVYRDIVLAADQEWTINSKHLELGENSNGQKGGEAAREDRNFVSSD